MNIILSKLKTYFLAGILTIVPVIFVIWLVEWSINLFDMLAWQYLPEKLLTDYSSWIGITVLILTVILIGAIISGVFGKWIIYFSENILQSVPFVRTVYSNYKRIFNNILRAKGGVFKKPVLVQYPIKGLWTVFITDASTSMIAKTVTTDGKIYKCICTNNNNKSNFWIFINC